MADEGESYGNEFFGIGFDMPEGWQYVTGDQVSSLNTPVSVASSDAVVDFVAVEPSGNSLVIISYEEANNANAGKTAEEYLESAVDKMTESIEGNYSSQSTEGSLTFEGVSFELPITITTITLNDYNFAVGQAVVEKEGNYLTATILGASEQDVLDTCRNFHAIA